jgi:hypothetical protein
MSFINHQPAPGLAAFGMGDLVPGMFVIPQNPIVPIRRTVGMGDFVRGKFIVPQNPIMAVIGRPQGGLSDLGDCGCGCSGGGGCRDKAGSGMGYINGFGLAGNKAPIALDGFIEDVTATASETWDTVSQGGTSTYLLIGAGVLALYFLTARDSGYKSAVASARAKYPTRYRRARRALAAAADSY